MSETKVKPVGNLTVIGAEPRSKSVKMAAYAKVFVKDEEGTLFSFSASTFSYGLEKEPTNAN